MMLGSIDFGTVLDLTLRAFFGVNAMYFAIAAIGLNVQFGYTGLLNFGQVAFMACGAYGLGLTAQYFDISMWWGIPLSILLGVLLGLVMGIPTLRLRADYLAIVTIAIAEVIRLTVRSVRFDRIFGGSDGISTFSGPYRNLNPFDANSPNAYGVGPVRYTGYTFYTLVVGWIIVALFAVAVWLLMRSPFGRILKAIREDEDAVRSLGKNVFSYKMQALILGGVIATFSGMMLSLDRGSVQPDNFSRDLTFYILTALVLGGVARVSGSIVGPMLFWALLAFIEGMLTQAAGPDGQIVIFGVTVIKSSSQVGQVQFMLVGLGLILLMVFRPQGLFGNRKEMALDGR
jgi:branched-chain amino acid transport system permease protein